MLLELLFNLYYEDHCLCITRLAAECQSVNDSDTDKVLPRRDADEVLPRHVDGCRELNRELHKL